MSKLIGLTGGIGCGKSSVASILENLGATIIDADRIGREVVETNRTVLEELVDAFGDRFLTAAGDLDRKAVGNYVFSSEERTNRLNKIVHPHLWKECLTQIDFARSQGAQLIVVDAALIYEVGLDHHFDGVVVVTASLDRRVTRIMARDGLTKDAIVDRIKAQWPVENKEKRATWLIRNDGTLSDLEREVKTLYPSLMS